MTLQTSDAAEDEDFEDEFGEDEWEENQFDEDGNTKVKLQKLASNINQ